MHLRNFITVQNFQQELNYINFIPFVLHSKSYNTRNVLNFFFNEWKHDFLNSRNDLKLAMLYKKKRSFICLIFNKQKKQVSITFHW